VPDSRIPGFHKLDRQGRREKLAEAGVDPDIVDRLAGTPDPDVLDAMAENVVGSLALPIGVATNFTIDDKDVLVPMATEESSVIAAASHGAKMAREHGGFTTEGGDPEMIAQAHLVDVDARKAQATIDDERDALVDGLRDPDGSMERRGGGPLGLETRPRTLEDGTDCLTVHLVADVRDAMGANYVNTLAEQLAPRLEQLTGGRAIMRILSNMATRRTVTARATFDEDALGGSDVVEDVVTANRIANADPHRAATHNKGVMNGITALVLATGNDTRAIEAGAHAYAAREGEYRALTSYEVTDEGHLRGELEVPIQVGTVGGATTSHPQAEAALELTGADSSKRLAAIAAAVGLAQNVSALRALVSEGIQEGHMRLHAVNLAKQAGLAGERVDAVVERMVEEDRISASAAREIADRLD
jgi:hydroxymethylglutaryl-CoA reductase